MTKIRTRTDLKPGLKISLVFITECIYDNYIESIA